MHLQSDRLSGVQVLDEVLLAIPSFPGKHGHSADSIVEYQLVQLGTKCNANELTHGEELGTNPLRE